MNFSRWLAACLLISQASTEANADWAEFGAAYRCNTETKTFTLVSTLATSSPDSPDRIEAPSDFTDVFEQPYSTIICLLGGVKIRAKIGLTSPQNGMCMGAGAVSIVSLTVNGKKVFPYPQSFSSGCGLQPELFELMIKVGGKETTVRKCFGESRGIGYSNVKCEESGLPGISNMMKSGIQAAGH